MVVLSVLRSESKSVQRQGAQTPQNRKEEGIHHDDCMMRMMVDLNTQNHRP